ncbi:TonB-dependent receptor [Flavobacterium croceum]|uniref:TonB-dependent receptor n=1 Tax=Flavobacterium croceum TaxID=370975 RepID=UPI0024A83B5B|nr:TonB-dependent receptor [Flavobacterium croceum]
MELLFKKTKMVALVSTITFAVFAQQTKKQDTLKPKQLEEVIISSIRVSKKTPVTFSDLNQKEIAPRNLGQDIPILMNFMPSVVTTSDAGNGFGYTGIRVRGSDATRVNVTINGIAYNDSESSGTFFVDMPDFASSLQSLQLQRGVGTSTNGSGAFGASLNLLTESYSTKAYGEIANSFGSFNSHKHTAKFSTGLFSKKFEISGRLSWLKSDGYIQRASSNLKSYFFQSNYIGETTLLKLLVFGGAERTYQAWNGIDADKLQEDRTYNYSGLYFDENGNPQFYKNEVDDYTQHHIQLHWNERLTDKWHTNFALHYTKGKGYYENFKEDASYNSYNLTPQNGNTTTDLARQKWLNNDFYGLTFSINYKKEALDFSVGGAYNQYKGKHYGLVNWGVAILPSEIGKHYYDYFGNKNDGNIYAKTYYAISKKWSAFVDLQYRNVTYTANGIAVTDVQDQFHFFNPKAGINYLLNKQNTFYFSYAKAHREPNRNDYENGTVKPEKLNDFELGWRCTKNTFSINWNLYYMLYKDQILLTGTIDDIGNPIRFNTDKSYRFGTEIDAKITISKHIQWLANTTISANKIQSTQSNSSSDISFSPNLIVGNQLIIKPFSGFKLMILNKFVGTQYLNNIESPQAKLNDYTTTDFNAIYTFTPKIWFDTITISGLVNNVFAKQYSSNGYMWDIYPYYYPQAKRNYLLGLTLRF